MEHFVSWRYLLNSIEKIEEKTILELGCGEGTKILLDKFKKVYSFEMAREDEWYKKCQEDYKSYSNWHSEFHFMKDIGLDVADNKVLESRGLVRQTEVLTAFYELLEKFVPTNTMDVVLVDQGFHMRGETVMYFFEKQIPYILIHDITHADAIYGWNKIVVPSTYKSKNEGITRLYYKNTEIH